MRGLESRAPGILLFYYFISFIFHITNCFVLGTEYAYHQQQQHRQHPHHHHHHKGPNRWTKNGPKRRVCLPFSSTSPAFAFSPDELQALVWALYPYLHRPCLCIHLRQATSARLGSPSISPLHLNLPAFALSSDKLTPQHWVWPDVHYDSTNTSTTLLIPVVST